MKGENYNGFEDENEKPPKMIQVGSERNMRWHRTQQGLKPHIKKSK